MRILIKVGEFSDNYILGVSWCRTYNPPLSWLNLDRNRQRLEKSSTSHDKSIKQHSNATMTPSPPHRPSERLKRDEFFVLFSHLSSFPGTSFSQLYAGDHTSNASSTSSPACFLHPRLVLEAAWEQKNWCSYCSATPSADDSNNKSLCPSFGASLPFIPCSHINSRSTVCRSVWGMWTSDRLIVSQANVVCAAGHKCHCGASHFQMFLYEMAPKTDAGWFVLMGFTPPPPQVLNSC